MERAPQQEKAAPMSLDEYLSALPVPYEFEGHVYEDLTHAFYGWLGKYHADDTNVDGVSLLALYEKNVLEVGMTERDFLQYCDRNSFPVPLTGSGSRSDQYAISFQVYKGLNDRLQAQAYKEWAMEHGIETAPGTVMRFIDAEGNEYRVTTGTKNRGQILT
jgi:hypothetical protein